MDIEIISEEENPMLHRTDVRFEVVHEEATPSRLSVRDSLAATLNKDAEEVVIHEARHQVRHAEDGGYAKVYDSPEFARDVEQDHMLERNKMSPTAKSKPKRRSCLQRVLQRRCELDRETCPRCGDTVLAEHEDRQHCGKCGYTEWK